MFGESIDYYRRHQWESNYQTYVFPNYDEDGDKSFIERAVSKTRIIKNTFSTVFIAGTLIPLYLCFAVSMWWLLAMILPVIGIILMMTFTYTSPFLSKIESRNAFRCGGDELAIRTANLLTNHPKGHRISSLIREKSEIEEDDIAMLIWVQTLCNIFDLEPNYSVDVIPLMNDDLKVVFDKVDEIDKRKNSVESVIEVAKQKSNVQMKLAIEQLERLEIGS